MTIIPHSLDRWLILDEPVWDAIRLDPGDPLGLLSLRLAYGLVEQAFRETIKPRLMALAATGARTVHIVAEQVDASLFSHLASAEIDQLKVQVHDWYRSPVGVMGSLDFPDTELMERLTSCDRGVRLVIWPPVAPVGEGISFRMRYRVALEVWERAARAEHGKAFKALYRGPIPWKRLLPDTNGGNAPRRGVASLLRGLVCTVAAQTGIAILPSDPRIAHAMTGSSVDWTYIVSDGGEVSFRIELPSHRGANIEVFALLAPGMAAPDGFALVEETGAIIVSAVTRWVAAGAADARLVSHHTFADEFGELRERFQQLRVQPELVLLQPQGASNVAFDSPKR